MSTNELFSFFEEILKDPKKFGSMEEISSRSEEILDEIAATLEKASPEKREQLQQELFQVAQNMNQKLDDLCEEQGIERPEIEKIKDFPSQEKKKR